MLECLSHCPQTPTLPASNTDALWECLPDAIWLLTHTGLASLCGHPLHPTWALMPNTEVPFSLSGILTPNITPSASWEPPLLAWAPTPHSRHASYVMPSSAHPLSSLLSPPIVSPALPSATTHLSTGLTRTERDRKEKRKHILKMWL